MRLIQRTPWWTLLLFAVSGFGGGFLTETGLSAAGRAPLVPPLSLPATLVTVSAVLLGFAIPLRRAISGATKKMVNPFVAVRIVAAAKASVLAGALFAGFGLGILIFFALRTVPPQADSWWPVIATVFAGIVQVAAGLIAEHFCRVPPPSSDAATGETEDGDGREASGALASTQHREQAS